MSIQTTYRIFRGDAIDKIQNESVRAVFGDDSNNRLAYELEIIVDDDSKNFDVVDFTQEDEPADNKWPFWYY